MKRLQQVKSCRCGKHHVCREHLSSGLTLTSYRRVSGWSRLTGWLSVLLYKVFTGK